MLKGFRLVSRASAGFGVIGGCLLSCITWVIYRAEQLGKYSVTHNRAPHFCGKANIKLEVTRYPEFTYYRLSFPLAMQPSAHAVPPSPELCLNLSVCLLSKPAQHGYPTGIASCITNTCKPHQLNVQTTGEVRTLHLK